MTYKEIIRLSKTLLEKEPVFVQDAVALDVFNKGAAWMYFQLNKSKAVKPFDAAIKYNFYGYIKYGICLMAAAMAATGLWLIHPLLTPLAIVVFYWCEVHFLFLFPLLLDNISNPLTTSIRQTYKFGVLRAMMIVMPVSLFMIKGLFNLKCPLKNWHVGSLAILILYQHEVRDRL